VRQSGDDRCVFIAPGSSQCHNSYVHTHRLASNDDIKAPLFCTGGLSPSKWKPNNSCSFLIALFTVRGFAVTLPGHWDGVWLNVTLQIYSTDVIPSMCHMLGITLVDCYALRFEEVYTGCPRSNVPDFGRVFLMLKYTDIIQNTYVQIWTVTEIMAREKCGLLLGSTHCTCQLTVLSVSSPWVWCHITPTQLTLAVNYVCTSFVVTSAGQSCVMYSAWNPKDNYDMSASVFVVQFNGFMSLTS
jgi:hypothetical protein